MDQAQLERTRDRLLAEDHRLREEVDRLGDDRVEAARAPGDASNAPTHAADRDAEGLSKDVELEKTLRGELRDVRQALERVREGSYGVCQRCGKAIDRERLETLPHTPYCLKCEQSLESA